LHEHGALLRTAIGEACAGAEAALEQFDFDQAHVLLSSALQARQASS
jgi:hypothetical protein